MEEEMYVRIPETDIAHGVPLVLTPRWTEADDVFASVRLSHEGFSLHAQFTVAEPQLRRMCTKHNDAVWTDSCAEIFLQKEGERTYRNFEFSAAGYVLAGNGDERQKRTLYPVSLLERIPVSVEIRENTLERSVWKMDIVLDLAAFDLADTHLRGNFYNCGDGLRKPHYLSYAPLGSLRPDFHRPCDFIPIELV